jgi:ATP-dependent helicase YprA (DUF1998 family)
MNALATDQAGRIAKVIDKDTQRHSPPDILLTNYKMLDYLLIHIQNYCRPIDATRKIKYPIPVKTSPQPMLP